MITRNFAIVLILFQLIAIPTNISAKTLTTFKRTIVHSKESQPTLIDTKKPKIKPDVIIKEPQSALINPEKPKVVASDYKIVKNETNPAEIKKEYDHNKIDQYIESSLNNSPDVKERLANKEESQNLVQQSYQGILPTITAKAGIGSQYSKSPKVGSKKLGADELSLDVHQNIFGEGRISDLKINQSVLNSKVYELEQIKNLVTLSTIEAYLNVIRHSAIAKIQQESIDTHNEILYKTKIRLDSGLMRASDLLLTQARTESSKSNLTTTLSQLDRAKNLLYRFSQIIPDKELQDFNLPKDLPKNFDDAWNDALQYNPIIKAKYHEVKTSDNARKKESIKLYPSLSLDLAAQKTYDSSGVNGVEEDLSAMLNMNYEFNFGSKYYAKSAATSRLQSTQYSYQKSKSDIYQSLNSLYTDYRQINDRIDFLKENRDFLEKVVEKHNKEFEAGFRSLLDLLNTKNEFFSADIQYVNALYDKKILAYTILANTGNLLAHFSK